MELGVQSSKYVIQVKGDGEFATHCKKWESAMEEFFRYKVQKQEEETKKKKKEKEDPQERKLKKDVDDAQAKVDAFDRFLIFVRGAVYEALHKVKLPKRLRICSA